MSLAVVFPSGWDDPIELFKNDFVYAGDARVIYLTEPQASV